MQQEIQNTKSNTSVWWYVPENIRYNTYIQCRTLLPTNVGDYFEILPLDTPKNITQPSKISTDYVHFFLTLLTSARQSPVLCYMSYYELHIILFKMLT